MIYLLHGGDQVSSRKKLEKIRSGYDRSNIEVFNAKDIDYPVFALQFSTISMFDNKRLIVVEGKIDPSQLDLGKIASSQNDVDLLIWIDSQLRSNDSLVTQVTKYAGTVELYEEKPDIVIFPFLDAVAKRNRIAAMKEYSSLLESDQDPIYIHTMLVWQFRMLLAPEKASGFVKKKVAEFSRNFSFDELRKIYYLLLQIEIQLKTGEGIPHVLLEQFILKITR
jgi:DNA polymerase III delta subunit